MSVATADEFVRYRPEQAAGLLRTAGRYAPEDSNDPVRREGVRVRRDGVRVRRDGVRVRQDGVRVRREGVRVGFDLDAATNRQDLGTEYLDHCLVAW